MATGLGGHRPRWPATLRLDLVGPLSRARLVKSRSRPSTHYELCSVEVPTRTVGSAPKYRPQNRRFSFYRVGPQPWIISCERAMTHGRLAVRHTQQQNGAEAGVLHELDDPDGRHLASRAYADHVVSAEPRIGARSRGTFMPYRAPRWRRASVVLITAVAMILLASVPRFMSSPALAAGTGDDYPSNLKTAQLDSLTDPWAFFNRECTSFAAWRLNQQSGRTSAPWAFTNYMAGPNRTAVHFGFAYQWDDAASSGGWPVNSTPAVGAVAQWNQNERGQGFIAGPNGHVAIVEAVNPDGSVTTEDYNALGTGFYATHTNVRAPRYLHIADSGVTSAVRRGSGSAPKDPSLQDGVGTMHVFSATASGVYETYWGGVAPPGVHTGQLTTLPNARISSLQDSAGTMHVFSATASGVYETYWGGAAPPGVHTGQLNTLAYAWISSLQDSAGTMHVFSATASGVYETYWGGVAPPGVHTGQLNTLAYARISSLQDSAGTMHVFSATASGVYETYWGGVAPPGVHTGQLNTIVV